MTRSELIAALREAKAGSRELDAAMWEAATGGVPEHDDWDDTCTVSLGESDLWDCVPLPCVTTSLDAITGLIERVLPECFWAAESHRKSASVYTVDGGIDGEAIGGVSTPALALCLALLLALETKTCG